jgi:hypothetical protein
MDWQTFLGQINAEYKDIGEDNPQIEIYDLSGNVYEIDHIYNEDGIVCIDIKRQQ